MAACITNWRLQTILGLALVMSSWTAQAAPKCSQVLSGIQNSGIQDSDIAETLLSLSKMRMSLDVEKAQTGSPSISWRQVATSYELKFQEAVVALKGRYSESEIRALIKKNIESLSVKKKSDSIKETEVRAKEKDAAIFTPSNYKFSHRVEIPGVIAHGSFHYIEKLDLVVGLFSMDKMLNTFDVKTKVMTRLHDERCDFILSQDESKAFVLDADGLIAIYDVATKALVKKMKMGFDNNLLSLEPSVDPTGRYMVFTKDDVIRIVDMQNESFVDAKNPIWGAQAQFLNDHEIIVSATFTSDTFKFDIITGKSEKILQNFKDLRLTVSDDFSSVVSRNGHELKLFNAKHLDLPPRQNPEGDRPAGVNIGNFWYLAPSGHFALWVGNHWSEDESTPRVVAIDNLVEPIYSFSNYYERIPHESANRYSLQNAAFFAKGKKMALAFSDNIDSYNHKRTTVYFIDFWDAE